ncbi:MAG: 16S rRNA (cytidine(1402)-2'-O)-methyltransferase [Saccharofermentanales bacterium]
MNKGVLFLVGTPIGNLSDISPRALQVLAGADLIATEDTRRTAILLNRYDIKKPMESYHNFNKEQKAAVLADRMLEGGNIALVSDAGMPCISDPGAELVALCASKGITVIVIPGPCAAISALSGSGLDSAKFVFEGFLASRGKDRKVRLQFLKAETRTMIFYEAPHRLKKTIKDFIANEWADRKVTFGRELTKIHEEFVRTTVMDAQSFYETNEPRGEFVIILEGRDEYLARIERITDLDGSGATAVKALTEASDSEKKRLSEAIDLMLGKGMPVKVISTEISKSFPMPKKEAYSLVQKRKDALCD